MIKNHLMNLKSNWFFLILIGFVVVLPMSEALVSVFAGLLFVVSLVEDSWENKLKRLAQKKDILLVTGVFFIYLVYALFNRNILDSAYDFKKALFFLVLPVSFAFGKNITAQQVRYIFYVFSFAVIVSTIVAFIRWFSTKSGAGFSVHNVSLISHIRFSFQLIIAFWFFLLLYRKNSKSISFSRSFLFIGLAIYFLFFLFFQQSLTGIIGLLGSILVILFFIFISKRQELNSIYFIGFIAVIVLPLFYVSWVVYKFYDFDKVNPETIERKTASGNLYWNDFKNKSVENGHYVYLYICEPEMRNEWNKISEMKYDSVAKNGYKVSSTLIRYLTSKGLHKDAEGVKSLSLRDIKNVENCIANVIYDSKKFSLYPRIYQTVWEFYVYSTTGNANNQSFSQRIEFAKAALTILKQHFWFGVGPGNWEKEFVNAYRTNHSSLNKKYYASSHNQYLNYMVKFGVIGFIVIFLLLLYPIINRHKFTDNLFVAFIALMFFANFADSNFEAHMGSAFFVFFYCLFLVTENNRYLRIENQNEINNL